MFSNVFVIWGGRREGLPGRSLPRPYYSRILEYNLISNKRARNSQGPAQLGSTDSAATTKS